MSARRGPLVVGCVSGAHGVQGGLRVHLHDSSSSSLRAGISVVLRRGEGGEARTFEVTRVALRPGSRQVRLWLAGVDSREHADALRGFDLWIEREHLCELAHDEFYLDDLIGLAVERARPDDGATQALGVIVGVTSNGAQDLYEVAYGERGGDGPPRTWLLPVLPQFLREISEDRVLVELPEGMLPSRLETA